MNIEKLKELKQAMEQQVLIEDTIRTKRELFEEQNSQLFMQQAKNREQILDCKVILIENALVGFEKDEQKKRLGGIGIRVSKFLEYDPKTALGWAKEKDLFLKIDKIAFDKVAKTGEIDFVTIRDKVSVTFPKEIIIEEVEQ